MKDLVWQAHPARERPGMTLALVAFLAALFAAVWLAFREPLFVALSVAVLGSALAPWFLPTTYRLDDGGASERRAGWKRARRWAEVRRVDADPRGATLSPFDRPSWLDPYRGMRLLFAGNRDEVLAALEEKLPGCRSSRPNRRTTAR